MFDVGDKLFGYRRFDQFTTRSLFVGVTLFAILLAMLKAFGIGIIFALLATGVIICISLIVAYHENRQAAKPDEQGSFWRSTLTFAVLLTLSGIFLVLVRTALRWLID